MSGRDQEGWDWMPGGASGTTIGQLMNDKGWFFAPPAGTSFLSLVTGRFGSGQALRVSGINGGTLNVKPLLAQTGAAHSSDITISTGFRLNAGNNIAQPCIFVYDAVNQAIQACVVFAEFGVVQAWRGDPRSVLFGGTGTGVLLGASDAGSFDAQVWEDVEVHFVINGSTGSIEVRFQTEAVLHLVSQNTQATGNAYCDSWGFTWTYALSDTAHDFSLDDLRVYDAAGTLNNTWLGTMKVPGALAASNGATLDFTRSNTGVANWQNIINQGVDDTLYLFDGTVSDFNLSGIQPIMASGDAVAWVGLDLFQRQDDVTQITSKIRVVSGGVTHDCAAYLPTQTYSADTEIVETDPNTGIQFTGAGVNALQAGPLIYGIA